MKKILNSILILLCLLLGLAFYYKEDLKLFVIQQRMKIWPQKPQEVWLNVFVHGTVGSSLGFLDFFSVQKDEIKKTLYKKAVGLMRKNHIFYSEQIIFDKGLHQVIPTVDYCTERAHQYAYEPLTHAFDIFSKTLYSDIQNIYYTFGWSGLLSQKQRRLEALNLFNSLSEEIVRLKNVLKIKPKIRLICHSHGGNVGLNLAGIYHQLQPDSGEQFYSVFNEGDYIHDQFKKLFKEVGSLSRAKAQGQKKYCFIPNKSFHIDEIVMLGTPIQYETSLFAFSPFFRKVLNLYSDQDVVQAMDVASTIKGKSEQTIDIKPESPTFKTPDLYQLRLAMDQNDESDDPKHQHPSWWQILLGLKNPKRQNYNPTHKELWFLVPVDQDEISNFLRPVPVVCLVPALSQICHALAGGKHLVCITQADNKLQIFAFDGHTHEQLTSLNFDLDFFNKTKNELNAWQKQTRNDYNCQNCVEIIIKDARALLAKKVVVPISQSDNPDDIEQNSVEVIIEPVP